jgi:antirestriction protein ArdC
VLADGSAEVPRNYVTNRPYTGINSLLLACTPYDRPYFLTFNQAKAKGGSIRKGAKGAIVVFWQISRMEKEEKDILGNATHKRVNVPLLRYYHVYNVADVEGLPVELPERRTAEVMAETELTAACDTVVAGYLNGPQLVSTNSTRAFYSPARDLVNVPRSTTFESPQAYYHVLFHELIHSTGHANRLNRKELVETEGYGGDNYSKEELTAELGACFLSAHCGLPFEQDVSLLQNAVAYLHHWLTALRNDKTLFVRAAGQAQKAANYILGTVAEEIVEAES